MLSPKKLVQMAKKWQRMAMLGRRRLTFERKLSHRYSDQCTSPCAEKGHFVVYTIDEKRFMISLDYINTRIITQLFQLSEEEFGYTVDGPITLRCEAAFMEYAIDGLGKERGLRGGGEGSSKLCFATLPSCLLCANQFWIN